MMLDLNSLNLTHKKFLCLSSRRLCYWRWLINALSSLFSFEILESFFEIANLKDHLELGLLGLLLPHNGLNHGGLQLIFLFKSLI